MKYKESNSHEHGDVFDNCLANIGKVLKVGLGQRVADGAVKALHGRVLLVEDGI